MSEAHEDGETGWKRTLCIFGEKTGQRAACTTHTQILRQLGPGCGHRKRLNTTPPTIPLLNTSASLARTVEHRWGMVDQACHPSYFGRWGWEGDGPGPLGPI
jgi:hypothetical protein